MSKPITKLKDFREKRFLSQTELAVMAGVTQGTISKAENGEKVSLGSIKKIAKALKVKPGLLV